MNLQRLALFVLLLSGVAAAQESATGLAGKIELARLVDLAAQRLGVTIEYDPSLLSGTTTVRSEGPISDAQLWALANQALAARGLTTVAVGPGGVLSVVKLADAPALVNPVPAEDLSSPAGYAAVIFTPQHRTPKELAESLSRLGTRAGTTVTALDDRRLLVSDVRPRLEQNLALLRTLDSPQRGITTTEVPLRGLSAVEAIATLTQIGAKRELLTGQKLTGEVVASPRGDALIVLAPESQMQQWRELIASIDRREPRQTVTYTPAQFPASEVGGLIERRFSGAGPGGGSGAEGGAAPRVVVDELTGSLIVSASAEQHEIVRQLLDRLDRAPSAPKLPMRSFVISHRRVDEVAEMVESLLRAGVLAAPEGLSEAPIQTPAAAAPITPSSGPVRLPLPPQAPDLPGPRAAEVGRPASLARPLAADGLPVTLTVDEGTNTLIVVGEPQLLAQVEALVELLDVRQRQVMLEVMMVSLSESQALELGVELEQITISGDVRIRLASLFGLGTRDSAGNRVAGDASGFTGVVLSPGDFSVVVRALETLNQGRSLSSPKLLVANNQEATLNSLRDEPYLSLNAGDNIVAQSYGGSVPAGTVVSIKPQISEGDSLILAYSVSLSAFVGAPASPGIPPPRQQNSIQSLATIPDGYTVVVGGIELANESQGTSQVPGLGSIPILGELFKRRSNSSNRSRFYVFIRASILRDMGFEDLKYISKEAIQSVGVDDGWPVVEPRVIR